MDTELSAIFEGMAGNWASAPALFEEYAAAAAEEISTRLTERMQEEEGRPALPINWDSERQRKAFFGTDGFGGGIPHVRTGEVAASWHSFIEVTKGGNGFIAGTESESAGAHFTRDMHDQSQVFMGYYPSTGDVLEEETAFIDEVLLNMRENFLNAVSDIGEYRPRALGGALVTGMISRYSELTRGG